MILEQHPHHAHYCDGGDEYQTADEQRGGQNRAREVKAPKPFRHDGNGHQIGGNDAVWLLHADTLAHFPKHFEAAPDTVQRAGSLTTKHRIGGGSRWLAKA